MNAAVRSVAALVAAAAPLLAGVAPAAARDAIVPSFDGAPLIVTLHPAEGLAPGRRAPTILQTHGWAGSRETNPDATSSEITGNVGVGPLRRAGFNVLTWDSRGFGDSGGIVSVDGPDFEGRDVQALLSWLAAQPEAELDAPGDPRAGMEGVSYAGGIELVSAGLDRRIDAIAPTIAWHSLLTALYREDTSKSGWGSALYGAGAPAAGGDGLDSPAGPQTGGLDPHITSAFASGLATGRFSAADRAWFDSRGPAALVERIRVPTLLVQGTADTLFTLSEGMRNAEILQRHGVPLKMMWFCGGHGVCLTGQGPAGRIEQAVIAWMRRHLAGDASVSTGPRFEWLSDDAQWRSTASYPPPHGAPLVGDGSGTLGVNPGDALSGTPVAAGPAPNAIDVPIRTAPAQVAGEPDLTLTYTATGTGTAGHVFAQIVDGRRNVVLGNQVTPIPIVIDGAAHTVRRSLEGVAAAVGADSRYTLQIVGGSQVYGPVRTTAVVTVSHAHVELPTVTGARVLAGQGVLVGGRRCTSRRRFVIHLRRPRHGRLVSARVTVAGQRVRVTRRHGRLRAVVNLRGKPRRTVRVRIVARTAGGRIVRETRRYETCAGAPR